MTKTALSVMIAAGTRFDSGITGDFDYADGFDLAIREFRCRGTAPREHRSCSVLSIDGVTLTETGAAHPCGAV